MNKDFVYKHLKEALTGPTSFDNILKIFDPKKIAPAEIKSALDELEKDGRIVKTRTDHYGIPEQMNLLTGRVKKLKKGFGFLVTDNMDMEDLFIPPDSLNSAQNGDRVIVRIMKHRNAANNPGGKNRDECEVVRILERHNKMYVGTYKPKRHYAFVVPDNQTFGQDIVVPFDKTYHAQDGDKVLVEITYWGGKGEIPEGEIIARLGSAEAPGVDVLSLVYRYDLSPNFTDEQLEEARRLSLQPVGGQLERRRDFRYYSHIVTIDGADSKDLDDAVQIVKLENGNYMLGVHIADVGEYIKEGSLLDKEAFRRGTSVYFVDRVLPMLPTDISNGICSLNAGEDRFALSCVMEINPRGRVVAAEISESIINVEKRFTYDTVNDIIKTQRFDEDPSYVETFNEMHTLSKILYKKRIERGALEFDLPESKVMLDDQGRAVDIVVRERGIAEQIIEEFMILANETVAAYFFRRRLPFIYRVHEEPEVEKRDAFLQYIQRLGIVLPGGSEHEFNAKDLQWILDKAEELDCAEIVSMMMLRMMNHAYYTTKKTSHFGLASRHYTHFTSPIRRYSDLSIHRLIKEFLQNDNRLNEHRIKHYEKLFSDASEQASSCERNAEEAERASVDLKKAEYMLPFVGSIYEAQIVSVTSFGFFVRLDNSVEGLVHISTLVDDYYFYDAENLCLVGEHSRRSFKLGQKVTVVLNAVNMKDATIDFVLKNVVQTNSITIKNETGRKKPNQVTATTRTRKKTSERTGYKKTSNKKRKTHRGSKNNSRKQKSKA
ncbi:MAG: ribonuclease R [Peptococcaceae bacterium]|nr:ribonuclease R [Peptococcaceae bacterium]